MESSCEHDEEFLDFTEGREFLTNVLQSDSQDDPCSMEFISYLLNHLAS
jgi:hypothetical protein